MCIIKNAKLRNTLRGSLNKTFGKELCKTQAKFNLAKHFALTNRIFKKTIKKHGEMAERSKAAVLKTVDVKASWGSNPYLSAISK